MAPKLIAAVLIIGMCNRPSAHAQFAASQPDRTIAASAKNQVIDSLLANIDRAYLYAGVAAQIEKSIRQHQKKGSYHSITGYKAFADTLNRQLLQLSNDKHLQISYSYDTVPVQPGQEAPIPEFIRQFAINNNYGFNKISILDGQVGYLNIAGFFPYPEATEIATAAFNFLANTKALIIDLRQNSGGAGQFADLITSYFFDPHPVHLLDLRYRRENRVQQSWSSWYVPGKRYLNKPVFILTSRSTFSAGEALAYILQSYKKAVIVGERTGGGENICELVRLHEHYVMNVPVGQPISPVTKTNWEKTGVVPDIEQPEAKALHTAHKKALEKMIEQCSDDKEKVRLLEVLRKVEAGGHQN